jgi:YVTN family beta-propeller protein
MTNVYGPQAADDDPEENVFEVDNTAVRHIPVRHGPISDLAISPDGSRLLVTNYGRHSISIIDTDTSRVVDTIAGLGEPSAIAMGSAGADRAYINTATAACDSVAVIDVATSTPIAMHRLALSLSDLAVSADGKYLYASRNGARDADVAIMDTATGGLEVVELASAPGTTTECVCVASDGRRLYVGTNGPFGGNLVAIETRSPSNGGRSRIVGTVELGLPIRDVALSEDGGTAYVASCGPVVGVVLDVVDTRAHKITATRKIDEIAGPLTRLTLSGDGRRAYLVSDDRITVLCTRTQDVVGEVRLADNPSCVVESPDGQYLYIADFSGVVTAARVVPTARLAIEGAAPNRDASVAFAPELCQREPVLA